MEGINLFGAADAIRNRPEAFKSLFTREQSRYVVNANYLVFVLQPEYSLKGSSRRHVEEAMMDFFQLFKISCTTSKMRKSVSSFWLK